MGVPAKSVTYDTVRRGFLLELPRHPEDSPVEIGPHRPATVFLTEAMVADDSLAFARRYAAEVGKQVARSMGVPPEPPKAHRVSAIKVYGFGGWGPLDGQDTRD